MIKSNRAALIAQTLNRFSNALIIDAEHGLLREDTLDALDKVYDELLSLEIDLQLVAKPLIEEA